MSVELRPFWVVWCPAHNPPQVLHPSERLATVEAERLARSHVGNEFIVLRAVSRSRVEAPPSITTTYDDTETDIPW